MPPLSSLYNGLPSLYQANEIFVNRERLFASVKSLLAEYGFAFGVCLVHAHCALEDEEIMLSSGLVSQPEKTSAVPQYYPERWLSSGEPYEFTTRPTATPPATLIEAFDQLTSHLKVLGLYHIDKEESVTKPGRMIEYTEGRKNILRPATDTDDIDNATHFETAWNLESLDPVTLACVAVIVCDSTTTRNGSSTHKGTKTSFHTKTK